MFGFLILEKNVILRWQVKGRFFWVARGQIQRYLDDGFLANGDTLVAFKGVAVRSIAKDFEVSAIGAHEVGGSAVACGAFLHVSRRLLTNSTWSIRLLARLVVNFAWDAERL